jgi:hypothetical protein
LNDCHPSGIRDVTENEQKQQLSVAYVHAVAAMAGYGCQVRTPDLDSVDVEIFAKGMVHQTSIKNSPLLHIQLKATSSIVIERDFFSFSLGLKNYNDLRRDSLVPKILVVLILPKERGQWLETTEECMISRRCAYWTTLAGSPETENSTSVSVRIPRSQQFTADQLHNLMLRISRQESL